MIKKDILVIDGAMVSRSPHVSMYLHILDHNNLSYDVAVWNRKGDDISNMPNNYMIYNHPTEDDYPAWRKLLSIYQFYKFVRSTALKRQYSAIVIFEIANAFFFLPFLKNKYRYKYIFDIRDYSPFMRIIYGQIVVSRLIQNSYTTVISSRGFQNWLPKSDKFTISHNIDIGIFQALIKTHFTPINKCVTILTIGNLRDPHINCFIAKSFSNNPKYKMRFVGDGAALPIIQAFCMKNKINNVSYYGHYQKQDEVSFYKQADIINCCMEDNMLSNYLMSNRIYLAALLQKPILCNEGSYQSSVIEKFHLGCIVHKNENPRTCLENYLDTFDYNTYCDGRTAFLNMIAVEQQVFSSKLINLVK